MMRLGVAGTAAAVGFVFGIGVGLYIGYGILCPSTDGAIVEQLKKDAPKVETIKKRTHAKKVKYANFNKAVDATPDTTGCSNIPDPALYELLRDPQYD